MVTILQWAFYISFVAIGGIMGADFFKAKGKGELDKYPGKEFGKAGFIGFVTNFADTLGIGSFAPIIALMKLLKLDIHDKEIPGTLNVSCTLPVLAEAILFTTAIEVESITLVALIVSAAVGAYIGAGIISKMDEVKIQLVMGVALAATAVLMFLAHPYVNLFPAGGDAIGLSGVKLIIGIVGNFILGALMTAGIGLYAPCMAMVFFLGMSARVAFPIMMGSCALLMPVASAKFIKEGSYSKMTSLPLALAGLVGVFIAYKFVTGVNLDILKLVVIAVIIFTSITMLKGAKKNLDARKTEVV